MADNTNPTPEDADQKSSVPDTQATSETTLSDANNAAGAPPVDTADVPPLRTMGFADPNLEKEIRAKAEKLGVKLEELLMLPMTHEDILYLLDRCPYLQMVNSESNSDMTSLPKLITAQSGWMIYDYGDAMCSSPGNLIFADNLPDPPFLYGLGTRAGAGDDETAGSGHGTILKQSVDTAAEMIFLAMQRGWKGATIVEGHPRMKWAAWVMAGDHEYGLQPYEPSKDDLERRKRLRRSRTEIDEIYMRVRKTMSAGSS